MTRPTLLLFALSLTCLGACGQLVDREVSCTTEARASVNVIVKDSMGAPVGDARVDYIVNGEMSSCEGFGDGSYVCGYEQSGDFTITAVSGVMEATERITVTKDTCHVKSEVIELTLADGSF